MELSVVIPTHDRPKLLRRCLDRVAHQPGVREVLVVAPPGEAVDLGRTPGARLLHAPGGASGQRNAGWQAARAPVVLFLGDDVLADPGLVAAHAAAHAREPSERVAVLGRVTWARELKVTPFMRFLEAGLQSDLDGLADGADAGWGRFQTMNVSVKRALLAHAGGFDAEGFPFLYEDTELGRRLRDHGLVLRYVAAAHAEHVHPATLDEWRERMRRVGAAERRYVAKHPDEEPWFRDHLRADPRASGRGRLLAGVVPERVPVLGPRVHASARVAWTRALAEAHRAGWDAEPGPAA